MADADRRMRGARLSRTGKESGADRRARSREQGAALILDADADPPELIPRFVAEVGEGTTTHGTRATRGRRLVEEDHRALFIA